MELLKEANALFQKADYTVATFEKLVELQNQAAGIEVTRIGDLIEAFLAQAPLDVVMEITRPNPKSPLSGWGL
ncbi:MAG: hypothetical protein ICV62_02670 [Cyanobacteria bacterium Co-bin13]|nr:hypothetical protein [Cyanobacteria bacterium Co-bin13]